MKTVILAGGFGSRLSEETVVRPKPMVEIGHMPILLHIMNIYAHYGIREFIVTLGYKGEYIKEFFMNFNAYTSDITVELATGRTVIHQSAKPDWTVHLVDTGLHTMTGGRLKRVANWLEDDQTFCFTYGDGVADLDLGALLAFHRSHGKLATITAVHSPARFGRLGFQDGRVTEFLEKPAEAQGWINGGYFVLNRGVMDYIEGDEDVWERGPVERLAHDGQLMGFQHRGFWSCMDTMKEKQYLEKLWAGGDAPWKVWA